jgi:hypothetical protein
LNLNIKNNTLRAFAEVFDSALLLLFIHGRAARQLGVGALGA